MSRFGRLGSMLDKSKVDKELARRLCAAFVSHQMGVGIATQYKKTPEDVGELWYFLAALADKLARRVRTPYTGIWDAWRQKLFNRDPLRLTTAIHQRCGGAMRCSQVDSRPGDDAGPISHKAV